MKFRGPKTGKVFDNIQQAQENFCPNTPCKDKPYEMLAKNCALCRINMRSNGWHELCDMFCDSHPTEAARMMGYEVIESEDESEDGVEICQKVKEDNMEKKDKPLSQLTLGELKEFCNKRDEEYQDGMCHGCQFCSFCRGNDIVISPGSWVFGDPPVAEDTSVHDKPAKPRLAEVLGVAVNEEFGIKTHSGIKWDYHVENSGVLRVGIAMVPGDILCYAINHPESIIRAPRLTEAELERCRVYGAKYLARDKTSQEVVMYEKKPDEVAEGSYGGGGYIGSVISDLFPSVRPGDCICVEEAGGDA